MPRQPRHQRLTVIRQFVRVAVIYARVAAAITAVAWQRQLRRQGAGIVEGGLDGHFGPLSMPARLPGVDGVLGSKLDLMRS